LVWKVKPREEDTQMLRGGSAESLDSLLARISKLRETYPVFPATPDGDHPTAEWPHDDPTGFFEFAIRAKAKVFYAHKTVLDDEASARLLDALTEDETLQDTSQFRAIAAAHRGEIVEAELGFFLGSVYHVYAWTADWTTDLSSPREEHSGDDGPHMREDWRARRREAEDARKDAAPKQREWSELLCRDDAFIAANNPVGRQTAASEAIPEMANLLSSSRSVEEDVQVRALRLAAWGAIEDARTAVRSKVRPQRERQTLADLDTVAAQLVARAEWDESATKTVQKRVARDFLEDRLGFTNAALTERVVEAARRKPPAPPV
jgi:hypothetical protein